MTQAISNPIDTSYVHSEISGLTPLAASPGCSEAVETQPACASNDNVNHKGVLTAEQLQIIELARKRGRKITRATTVASISGWTMAVFAFVTILGGLFSLAGFLLGVGLAAVAFVELKGAKKLRRHDLSAPRLLGFNQIALSLMICAYGGWMILQTMLGPNPYEQYLEAGGAVADSIQPIAQLHMVATFGFYGMLIVISIIAQGSTALYYFTRRHHMVAYLKNTPQWVVNLMQAARG